MSDETINYEAVLAALRKRRSKLDTAIQAIEELLRVPGSDTPLGAPVSETPASLTEDMFLGMSAPKAAFTYLQMVKRPRTTRQIADALKQGGLHSTGSNYMNIVYTALSRRKDIVRLGKKWGLKQRHPGARTTTQRKKVNGPGMVAPTGPVKGKN